MKADTLDLNAVFGPDILLRVRYAEPVPTLFGLNKKSFVVLTGRCANRFYVAPAVGVA